MIVALHKNQCVTQIIKSGNVVFSYTNKRAKFLGMGRNTEKERNEYSDQELLENIARQDTNAFSILYDRHASRLFGLAVQILKDRTHAEDVLQDIYLSLWKNAGSYDPEKGNPVTWLLVLCRNRCIDKLRELSNKASRSSTLSDDILLRLEADPAENPYEQAKQSECQAKIKNALQQLPVEQRKLIEMAYFGGFTQSEISNKLSLPLGTVKTRIRLGMQKLKNIIVIA